MAEYPEEWDDNTISQLVKDYRKKRDRYWAMLRRVRNDFVKECPESSDDEFYEYLIQTYGFSAKFKGAITEEPTILNEQKYTIFLLRYL